MEREVIMFRKKIKMMERRLDRIVLENQDLLRDNTALICENMKLRSTVRCLENNIANRTVEVKTDLTTAVIILSGKSSQNK
ncbi:hypothetical protein [Clostridium sp. LP20]|uniref:hypothetical protein n=1 Tax=Clostridium sp. LP20 TaxID=3418665 RepID=UPI003EE63F7F